jgi:hypothetical protein
MPLQTIRTFLFGALVALLLTVFLSHRLQPAPTFAQNGSDNPIYIEPGVKMLRAPDGSRQVLGKVVIDLHSGKVWGFPTTVDQPFPVDVTSQQPPTSRPFLLGKFDFSAMYNQQ